MVDDASVEGRRARQRFYHQRLYPKLPWWLIPGGSVILYAASALFVFWYHSDRSMDVASFVVIGIWTLGPPTVLLLEYFLMPKLIRDADALPDIEAFKYTREMARNFWIAAVAVLIALHSGGLPGGGGG